MRRPLNIVNAGFFLGGAAIATAIVFGISRFLSNKVISREKVNLQIRSKFCKVITPYHEGTGYIVDDQKGKILTCFHLFGIQTKDILPQLNINFTKELKLLATTSKEFGKFKEELEKEFKQEITKTQPRKDDEFTLIGGQAKLPNKNKFFSKKINKLIKKILESSGYLDRKHFLTEKALFLIKDELDIQNEFKDELINELADFLKNNFIVQLRKILCDFIDYRLRPFLTPIQIHYRNVVLRAQLSLPVENNYPKYYLLINYASYDVCPIEITSFDDGTAYDPEIRWLDTGPPIQTLPSHYQLREGEEVYFGGYPITQNQYTFTCGVLSAIRENQILPNFTIDAPISPGNSGGPVFVQRNEILYCVGFITSAMASIPEALQLYWKSLPERTESQSHRRVTRFQFGFINQSTIPEDLEEAREQIDETKRDLTELQFNNFSTGRGQAIGISHYECIESEEQARFGLVNLDFDFLVPKKIIQKVREKPPELYKYINEKRYKSQTEEEKKLSPDTYISFANLINYITLYADDLTKEIVMSSKNLEFLDEIKSRFLLWPYALQQDVIPDFKAKKIKLEKVMMLTSEPGESDFGKLDRVKVFIYPQEDSKSKWFCLMISRKIKEYLFEMKTNEINQILTRNISTLNMVGREYKLTNQDRQAFLAHDKIKKYVCQAEETDDQCWPPAFLVPVLKIPDVVETEFARNLMLKIYSYCLLISQNRLEFGRIKYRDPEDVDIQRSTYMTEEFFEKHMGEGSSKQSKKKADTVAHKRLDQGNVTCSTMINSTELDTLNGEIKSKNDNGYYQAVHTYLETEGKLPQIIESVLFQTQNAYQLHSRTKTGYTSTIGKTRGRQQFYYSVFCKSQTYYLSHFAGPTEKKSWQKVEAEKLVSTGLESQDCQPFYYKLK